MICVPSATEFYLSKNGKKVPLPSDSPKDREILYSMLNPETKVETVYAISSEARTLEASLKDYARQKYKPEYFFLNNLMKLLSTSAPTRDLDSIYQDFCKFPCNPESNIFRAATLAIDYVKIGETGDAIKKYLDEIGIEHLDQFSLDIYPVYYLFFLLTRFFSFPLSETQIQFAQERSLAVKATEGQKKTRLIDAIFDDPDISITFLYWSDEEYKEYLKTPFDDWQKWTLDYLFAKPVEKLNLKKSYSTNELADILYTWSDNQIVKFAEDLEFTLPTRDLSPTRKYWIDLIANCLYSLKLFGPNIAEIPEPIRIFPSYDLILY